MLPRPFADLVAVAAVSALRAEQNDLQEDNPGKEERKCHRKSTHLDPDCKCSSSESRPAFAQPSSMKGDDQKGRN